MEGNPDHPGSLGATDYFQQASVLQLYDPDRSQVVLNRGRISSWISFQSALARELAEADLDKGAGFRILTETCLLYTSRSLGNQVAMILDGGPTQVGIESTVLSLTGPQPLLLRLGMVSLHDIEDLIGPVTTGGAPSLSLIHI